MRRCLKSSYKQNVSCILESACITDTAHSIATPNTVTFRGLSSGSTGARMLSSFRISTTPDRSQGVGSRKEIAAKPPLSCLCSYGVLRTSCLVICKRQQDSDHITFTSARYKVRRNSIREGWSRQCLSLPVPPSTSHLASAFAFIQVDLRIDIGSTQRHVAQSAADRVDVHTRP